MKNISPYAKALAGFAAGAVVAYLGATDGGVTAQEWLQVLLAGLGGSGLVYVVPNKAAAVKPVVHRKAQRGAVDVVTVLVVVLLVVLVLFLVGVLR